MPRIVALDWTRREARFVVASHRGSELTIEAAGALPLDPAEDAGDGIAARLEQALASHRPGKAAVLIGIDRSQVESLELTLPPAADSELPQMVLHQAMRESPVVTEESALDFVPVGGGEGEPRRVMAVALVPERLRELQAICERAGLAPQRILFRPLAAASLYLRHAPEGAPGALLVNIVDDSADLTIVDAQRAVLARSVRLPALADETLAATRLSAEIRRTVLLAPPAASGAANVARIVFFGSGDEHRALTERVAQETGLAAELFDPFDAVKAPASVVPDDAGRFASLVGMAADEAAGKGHAIDLLNPRRPAPPVDRKRPLIYAGAAAVLAAGLLVMSAWNELSSVDALNGNLDRELKEVAAEIKRLDKSRQLAAAVDEWEHGGVNWLDEFRNLSARFPSSRDAVVLRMSMSPSRGGGGVITLQGQARDPAVVEKMGQSLRDAAHEIQTPRVQERLQEKAYTWSFETSIFVSPADDEQLAAETERPAAANGRSSAGNGRPAAAGSSSTSRSGVTP